MEPEDRRPSRPHRQDTGDGLLVEFGSVVDAPRSADEVQTAACIGLPANATLTISQSKLYV
jgi:hypothetical protein